MIAKKKVALRGENERKGMDEFDTKDLGITTQIEYSYPVN